jgi:uncharacterized membrane protein (UPF0136 family)
MSTAIVAIYLYVFGAITIAGGVVGFVKAKSRASLIAGGISGALLVVAGYLVGSGSRTGLFLGLLVSLALAGRFGMAFKKSRKVMPAGLILVLALAGIVLSALALKRSL